MAVLSSILVPANETAIKVAAIATVTSSAEIVIGANRIFAINATGDITIKFGNAGLTAADATNYRIPANQQTTFDTGQAAPSIRVFNLAGTATDVYIQLLSRI